MSILDDIGTVLTDAALVGGATGWTLAKGFLPPDPDQVVALHHTAGDMPDHATGESHNFPSFQVLARAGKFKSDDAETKLAAIFAQLQDTLVANYIYVQAQNSGFIDIGQDDNERPQLVVNFETMETR